MQLSLIASTGDFTVDGFPYADVPLFVDTEAMRIVHLPTEWMTYLAVIKGSIGSSDTWWQYAYNLSDWIRFSEKRGWDWMAPSESYIGHFKSKLRQHRPILKRNTIVKKLQIVCWFYEWAHINGYIATLPLTYEARRYSTKAKSLSARPHSGQLAARPVLLPKAIKETKLHRYFTKAEQERIFANLSDRDKLIACWALFTGMREHEICALVVSQIPNQNDYRSSTYYKLALEETKGDRPGDAYVPNWLLDATYQYMALFERKSVVRSARDRGKDVPQNIFLGRWGTALEPNSVYKNFKAALTAAGISGTFHDLRHTYAITMLDRLMRACDTPEARARNPVLILKRLLRHSRFESTEIYLDSRNEHLTDVFHDTWDLPEELWPTLMQT